MRLDHTISLEVALEHQLRLLAVIDLTTRVVLLPVVAPFLLEHRTEALTLLAVAAQEVIVLLAAVAQEATALLAAAAQEAIALLVVAAQAATLLVAAVAQAAQAAVRLEVVLAGEVTNFV